MRIRRYSYAGRGTGCTDAMGGDHAPEEMIKGAVEAVNEKNNIHVLLVGQEDVISEELENIPILRKEWRLSMHPK